MSPLPGTIDVQANGVACSIVDKKWNHGCADGFCACSWRPAAAVVGLCVARIASRVVVFAVLAPVLTHLRTVPSLELEACADCKREFIFFPRDATAYVCWATLCGVLLMALVSVGARALA